MQDVLNSTPSDPQELARRAADVASDMKGTDIVLLDLREVTHITDYFVIVTANSDRQLKAIVENITDTLHKEFKSKPARTEGKSESGWMLMDYLDFVVHVFTQDQRNYYNLEEFWQEAHVLVRLQ